MNRMRKYAYIRIMLVAVLIFIINNILFNRMKLAHFSGGEEVSSMFVFPSGSLNNISDTNATSKEAKSLSINVSVTSKCTGIVFPTGNKISDNWNAVDLGKEAYVFSAYLNQQTRDVVIIGALTRHISVDYCQFWYELNSTHVYMEESSAARSMLPEAGNLRYTSTLFHCKCPSSKVPTYISLVTKSCGTPLNLIRTYSISSIISKRKFTVCLSPLHFNYSRDYELIEWIELNRILGAEKFVFYNYSTAANVGRILKYYSERGIAEVVQWQLPMGVDTFPRENKPIEIYYLAQAASFQDCLYRNQFESEFIVNIDVDEFIIPHSKDVNNWSDMLKSLSNDIGVYLFRNTFFRKEWNNTYKASPNSKMAEQLKLVTILKVEHETTVWLPRQRSKYIARTADVSGLMTHEVSGLHNGKKLETVPLEIGFLHHYRNWEIYDNPPSSERIVDTTVPDKFSDVLINRVRKVWLELGKSF